MLRWLRGTKNFSSEQKYSDHKIQTEIISKHKISDCNHFRAQKFRLKSFQSTKFQTEFQTEIISEYKISN